MTKKAKQIFYYKTPVIPAKIAKKWAGKTAAVVNNKVVAGGATSIEAIKNARKLYPRRKPWEIGLVSVPTDELMIL